MSYMNIPNNKFIITLLKNEGLEGPGLNISVQFLGISYITVGSINLLAAAVLSINEACYVLIASGFLLHFGVAAVRSIGP